MTRYDSGANFEREVKADLISKGWAATRSAGSHGEVDVMGYHFGIGLFVQCKKHGAFPLKERNALIRLAVRHNAIPLLAEKVKVLFGKRRRGVIRYSFLCLNGEKGEEFLSEDIARKSK